MMFTKRLLRDCSALRKNCLFVKSNACWWDNKKDNKKIHNLPRNSNLQNKTYFQFPLCVVTGRPMLAYRFWLCSTCKQNAYEEEISSCTFCPLCHSDLT
ncbi:hypothetical protein RB195_022993 [Necator americanus]|uniref:IFT121-like zinc finger domain-containing protein n=1 Tax=Necator americanus TaxID=51031 RepID=A0ABR1EHD4_NECAM